ncbi:hypothetical protein APASM_6810 [Actinosynnema pretiosum subsp. pretiosum]|nr:hypothetical protein APASM_6810 [Actinosynnema pretiosum subsp. pretiosum]
MGTPRGSHQVSSPFRHVRSAPRGSAGPGTAARGPVPPPGVARRPPSTPP